MKDQNTKILARVKTNKSYYEQYPSPLTNIKYNPISIQSIHDIEYIYEHRVKVLQEAMKSELSTSLYSCVTGILIEEPSKPEHKPIVIISSGRSGSIGAVISRIKPELAYDPREVGKVGYDRPIIFVVHEKEKAAYQKELKHGLVKLGAIIKGHYHPNDKNKFSDWWKHLDEREKKELRPEIKKLFEQVYLLTWNVGYMCGFGASRAAAVEGVKKYFKVDKIIIFDDDVRLTQATEHIQYDTDSEDGQIGYVGFGNGATTKDDLPADPITYKGEKNTKKNGFVNYVAGSRDQNIIQQAVIINISDSYPNYNCMFITSGEDLAMQYGWEKLLSFNKKEKYSNKDQKTEVRSGMLSGTIKKIKHEQDEKNPLNVMRAQLLEKLYEKEKLIFLIVDEKCVSIEEYLNRESEKIRINDKKMTDSEIVQFKHNTSSLIVERILLDRLKARKSIKEIGISR